MTWLFRALVFLFSFVLADHPWAASFSLVDAPGQGVAQLVGAALVSPFWVHATSSLWLLALVPAVLFLLPVLERGLGRLASVTVTWLVAIVGALAASFGAQMVGLGDAGAVHGGATLAVAIAAACLARPTRPFSLGKWQAKRVTTQHIAAAVIVFALTLAGLGWPAIADLVAIGLTSVAGYVGSRLCKVKSESPGPGGANPTKKPAGHLRVVRSAEDLLH